MSLENGGNRQENSEDKKEVSIEDIHKVKSGIEVVKKVIKQQEELDTQAQMDPELVLLAQLNNLNNNSETVNQGIEQEKKAFVDSTIEKIYKEIDQYAESNNGTIPYMGKQRSWEKLKKMPLFGKMLQGIFYSENPSGRGIMMIAETAPNISREIAQLDQDSQEIYELSKISGAFQTELDIVLYKSRGESFNKLRKAVGK